MTAIFLTVLRMSLSASIVAVVVILARLCLRKAPKVFSYVLWSAVLLRLVCPFALEVNVPVGHSSTETAYSQAGQYESFENSLVSGQHIQAGLDSTSSQGTDAGEHAANSVLDAVPQEQRKEAPPKKTVNATDVISIVWSVGLLAMLGYMAWSYYSLRAHTRSAIRLRGTVYESDRVSSAFVFGILSPRVYIPAGMAFDDAKNVILHEQTHIRRKDHIVKAVSFIALAVHWFNPVMWLCYWLMNLDMEKSCDEAVLRSMSARGYELPDVKRRYGKMLIALASNSAGVPSVAFSESSTKSRLTNVLGFKKTGKGAKTALCVLCSVVILACLVLPRLRVERASGEAASSEPVQTLSIDNTTFQSDVRKLELCSLGSEHPIDFSPLLQCSKLEELHIDYSYAEDFSLLTQIPSITHLSIYRDNENPLTAEDLAFLPHMKNLRHLTVNFYIQDDFDYSAYTVLSEAESLDSLKIEIIHSCSVDNIDDSYLALLKNIKYLDVSSNHLDPSFLSEMNWLRGLRMSGISSQMPRISVDVPRMNELESLALFGLYCEDLSFISRMPQLKELVLEESDLEGLSFLEPLTSLETLRLVNTRVIGGDIAPISALTGLTKLELSLDAGDFSRQRDFASPQIADLAPLASLKNIVELDLTGNYLRDISPLISMKKLSLLDLSYNNIEDISCLNDMSELTEIDLSNNMIDSIAALSGKGKLSRVDVSENRIADVAALSKNKSIKHLALSGNRITDLSPIAGNTGMVYLDCSHNAISDISMLSKLTELRQLDVSNNAITSAEGLSSLTNLRELSVCYNDLGDLSFAENMRGLEMLRARNNSISDLTPLAELTRLTLLWLNCNQIEDISPLSNMQSLNMLLITNNRISDASTLLSLGSLFELNIEYNDLTDAQMNELREAVEIFY